MFNKQSLKSLILWAGIILAIVLIVSLFQSPTGGGDKVLFSEFEKAVHEKAVAEVTITGMEIEGKFTEDGAKTYAGKSKKVSFSTTGIVDSDLREAMLSNNTKYEFESEGGGEFMSLLVIWVPMLIMVVFFVVFMRQLQSGGGKAMSFGKSKARLLNDSQNKITFDEIAGIEEAKQELMEIVEFLRDPKKFTRLGGRIPKGVLLMGPPGTGKTLLARGVAGEAGVPFYSISGSDFVEMFVGVGASRVRDLFEQGKKNAPCIIFIDEIDAVGRQRGAGVGGGHDEREQTLNQLLVEMDGLESNEGIILIAATNRPDVLDPALLRPGRFDRRVVVPRPDVAGREKILKVHTRKTPLGPDVELPKIARGTPGFSGADLENLVNEAALGAARLNKDRLEMDDFEEAKDKVMMGAERKSAIISDQEKRVTAYHEAGHALVAALQGNTDPVHKVTIIPRGRALGVTQQLPTEDRLTMTKDYVVKRISILMGGRAAEEIIFGDITTGAGQDIQQATDLTRRMVCEWGMSEKLGPVRYAMRSDSPFMGRDGSSPREFSERTARDIDEEVHLVVTSSYDVARTLLYDNLEMLKQLAEALLQFEVLNAAEVRQITEGATVADIGRYKELQTAEAAKTRVPKVDFNTKLRDEVGKIADDEDADDLGLPTPEET